MPKRLLAAAIVGSLLLTGCDLLTTMNLTVPRGSAEITLVPQIVPGGFRALALVKSYDAEDIDHLLLKLFRLDGTREEPVTDSEGKAVTKLIPGQQLDSKVVFGSLLPDTTYRIRAYAYKAEGEDPGNLISEENETSFTDVSTSKDDAPVATSLKVKLADVFFNGRASAEGILVTPGGFRSNDVLEIHLGDMSNRIHAKSPFWAENMPLPSPGMTWVYENTSMVDGIEKTLTMTLSVVKVQDNVVTFQYEHAMEGSPPQSGTGTSDLERHGGYPDSFNFDFENMGQETVSVPAGTYSNAIKLVDRSDIDEMIVWVVPGIGRVKEKLTNIAANSPTTPFETRLKQFTAP